MPNGIRIRVIEISEVGGVRNGTQKKLHKIAASAVVKVNTEITSRMKPPTFEGSFSLGVFQAAATNGWR